MSEEEKGAAAPAPENSGQPQIMIQRVYLKDLSFESPNSPQSFTAEWKPEVSVDLNSQARQLNETSFEVVLRITITAKAEDKTVYLTEVQQAGLFHIANVPQESMGQVLGAFCPNILFPYARVNFDALFAQNMAQKAAQAAPGEESEPAPEQTH